MTSEGIVTEVGVFCNLEQLEPGERVEVMIRPDDITFVPHRGGPGVIAHREFRGPEALYRIELPSGRRLHSSQPSSSRIPPGTRVRAEAHVLHVVTFPAARTGASVPRTLPA